MTPELAQAYPEELRQLGDALPDILLPYQKKGLLATASHSLVIWEKSRRIGATWGIAADAVLASGAARSAGGMDTMYIGYNLDMAREFIDTCAMWAKAFLPAATAVEEFLFIDQEKGKEDREIQAFRITFASGFEITALTSKPRSLRGRQGYLIFDEAAFHDDLAGMLKAAMAFLIWGGKVLVISTHDGEGNAFNGLINDVREGRRPGKVITTTFDEAIEQGLYERVKMMLEARGQRIELKKEWVEKTYSFYGDDANEELRVIPAQGTGTALSGALIEMRMTGDAPVLRWEKPKDWVKELPAIRQSEALEWCEENLLPLLNELPQDRPHYLGEDFGRLHDLSCFWPITLEQNLVRRAPFIVELGTIPFAEQRLILFYILDRLPRFVRAALDAGGIGAELAENAADRYGQDRIEEIKLSVEWYRENMPRFIAAFQDGTVLMPRDSDVLTDHRILKKIDGVVRVPPIRTEDSKNKGRKRHGDTAIAHALAHYATISEPISYGGYQAVKSGMSGSTGKRNFNKPHDDDDIGEQRWNSGAY